MYTSIRFFFCNLFKLNLNFILGGGVNYYSSGCGASYPDINMLMHSTTYHAVSRVTQKSGFGWDQPICSYGGENILIVPPRLVESMEENSIV